MLATYTDFRMLPHYRTTSQVIWHPNKSHYSDTLHHKYCCWHQLPKLQRRNIWWGRVVGRLNNKCRFLKGQNSYIIYIVYIFPMIDRLFLRANNRTISGEVKWRAMLLLIRGTSYWRSEFQLPWNRNKWHVLATAIETFLSFMNNAWFERTFIQQQYAMWGNWTENISSFRTGIMAGM